MAEVYCKEQGLFRTDSDPAPHFDEILDLDLSAVEPSLAGPRRPQDRVSLSGGLGLVRRGLSAGEAGLLAPTGLTDGSVVIAAITSCTNTSNPSVMIAAGLWRRRR